MSWLLRAAINATKYRNVSLSLLTESKTNPRRVFEDATLKELADSIRSQGVLSPLLVRPLTERSFEIVAGARRFRAAQMVEAATVPIRIVNLSDAEALEAQLIENLQRRDVQARTATSHQSQEICLTQLYAKRGLTICGPRFIRRLSARRA